MLTPRKLLDMPPDEILRLPPCMDLDRYILEKVLDGPLDLLEETGLTAPMFSRNLGHCYPVLIMCVVDGDPLTVSVDDSIYESAARAGQIVRKTEVKSWCVSSGNHKGYGRTFPEAVCKLAICKKFDIRG
jgi:hypothetical protein